MTTSEVATERSARVGGWDRLRGLAVSLMVLDHVLVVSASLGGPDVMLVRLTATRLAMPLFAMLASCVWSGRPSGRTVRLLGLALVAEWSLNAVIGGLAAPGPVTVLVLVMALVTVCPVLVRQPLAALLLGLVSALYWPGPWPGYDPGLILAYWSLPLLGANVPGVLQAWGDRLPSWLGYPGRSAALWYSAHLAVLAGVVAVLG